jgi:chitinase
VGYATGWDPGEDKDAGKIGTLIFAFAKLVDGRVALDTAGEEHLHRLIALKAAYLSDLKAI